MKRTKLLTVLSVLFLLAGCGEKETATKFYASWDYDETYHWHNAIGDSDEIDGKGEHSLGETRLDNEGKEYRLCSVCKKRIYGAGGGGSGSETEDPNVGVDKNGFTNVTKFNSEVEIHTEKQLEYLSYSGEYVNIPSGQYPDGNKLLSDPVKTKITWDYEGHSDSTQYSVSISQKSDMSDSFEIKGTNSKELEVYNLYLGKNYYRVNATESGSVTSSGVYALTVKEDGPRNLYVGANMTNCRDCGGRTTIYGGKIKQGLIYRTCGNGYTTKSTAKKIDDEGKDIMVNQLKMKSELDVSDSTKYNFNFGSGVTIYDTYMDYGGSAKHHFSRNAESVKNVFEIFAKPECLPTFFHCRIGTDRTGLIANLFYGLLGVDLNMIYQDYLFSNFGNIEGKRYVGSAAGEDDITKYMNEINSMPGTNFQERTYNALLSIGVPAATLDAVINNLTEGPKGNNSKGQIVIGVDDMSLNGTQKKTESKTNLTNRNNPASYATLSANATATATFSAEGNKTIYAYLGHNESVTSKYVDKSIEVTVDGQKVTMASTSFKEAGMGNVNNRVNYYFVKIGTVENLSDSDHEIVIKGLANNMNLGYITVLDNQVND